MTWKVNKKILKPHFEIMFHLEQLVNIGIIKSAQKNEFCNSWMSKSFLEHLVVTFDIHLVFLKNLLNYRANTKSVHMVEKIKQFPFRKCIVWCIYLKRKTWKGTWPQASNTMLTITFVQIQITPSNLAQRGSLMRWKR